MNETNLPPAVTSNNQQQTPPNPYQSPASTDVPTGRAGARGWRRTLTAVIGMFSILVGTVMSSLGGLCVLIVFPSSHHDAMFFYVGGAALLSTGVAALIAGIRLVFLGR